MVQNAEIIVELYENGITIKWSDPVGGVETKSVATDEGKIEALGREIWGDLESIFDNNGCEKVRVKLEYEIMED